MRYQGETKRKSIDNKIWQRRDKTLQSQDKNCFYCFAGAWDDPKRIYYVAQVQTTASLGTLLEIRRRVLETQGCGM